ncbi:MAG: hypothetical protein ACI94Y_000857 [Maribacter sp.]|jgi:hypothetical protein
MKHTIITLLFFVLASQMIFAQPPGKSGMKKEAREKIEALRKAYISDKLELTEKESNEFWPIYTSYKSEEKVLMHTLKKQRRNVKEMSDAEADVFIENVLETEQKRLDLKKKYYTKMKTAISAKKILGLERSERSFRSEVMKRMKENRGKRKKGPPPNRERNPNK